MAAASLISWHLLARLHRPANDRLLAAARAGYHGSQEQKRAELAGAAAGKRSGSLGGLPRLLVWSFERHLDERATLGALERCTDRALQVGNDPRIVIRDRSEEHTSELQ